jgi:uncharacterized protein (TIGR01777 family)
MNVKHKQEGCHESFNLYPMASILITGGTGMIGSVLVPALLDKGHRPIVLVRGKIPVGKNNDERVTYSIWDPANGIIDDSVVRSSDAIIHLAGTNVAEKRWTNKRKEEIVQSRVKSGALLSKVLSHPNKVKAVVSSSAIGWYGPDPVVPNPAPFKETDPADESFLGQTCLQWEQSIEAIAQMGIRLVKLRTGIVLGKKGGALEEFRKPLKFGIATTLGTGKQVLSWIHIDDLVRLFITAVEDERFNGVYNAVSPHPITNKELIKALASQRGKFNIPIRVPSFALKLALGELSVEILKSATVSSSKVEQTGFNFEYGRIEKALEDTEKDKR